jgi:hypothetical protein
MRQFFMVAGILSSCLLLTACEPLSLTALGIGGTTAVNHKMSGTSARTFTASLGKVKIASIAALKRMGIKADSAGKKIENGEVLVGRAGSRDIEVELESLTPTTTRMRVVARDGPIFYDAATASEIISQTGKGLGV